MPRIHKLSQHIVNKIAAGEVVERPASVIKEMMENSLDAGATRIDLEVEDGGRKLIRISDNGCGMEPEDVELAFAQHATSKISSDEDLFEIATMGFRGEALASIASVSQVEVISRPHDAIEGSRLSINAGQASAVEPAAAAPGTVITVRNLFFNTPARRKFLRTENTEMGHISEQFNRIALSHTHAQLSLTHNGRKLQDLPANQTLSQRIGMLFSNDLAEALFPVQREADAVRLSGLVAHPQQSRTGSQWQYIFVNGRHIRDKFIGHAIREAYRGMMEINRSPVVFLFISLPPQDVDVNVHPAKTEVRFANSNMIHSIVLAAIRDRLLGSDLSVPLKTRQTGAKTGDADNADDQAARQQRVRQAMADFFKSSPADVRHTPAEATPSASGGDAPEAKDATASRLEPLNKATEQHQLTDGTLQFGKPPTSADDTVSASEMPHRPPAGSVSGSETNTIASSIRENASTTAPPRPIVQIHNAYLILENDKGVEFIDQHALHERILYEKLIRQFREGKLPAQRRLIPEVIDVTPKQLAMAEEHADFLESMGIMLEQFGPQSLAVQSFPALLEKSSPETFIRDLLDIIIEQAGRITREELIHHIFDMLACKAAVKAGDPLTDDEIHALISQRHLIEQSGTCPHGRPTTIKLTLTDLEKQFKRT